MFTNSSPLNWHNTLKRLRKDDDFGRSPHSLNHLIVKKRPQSLYIAQATKNLVKSVDKLHKIVPGIKEQVKQSGAKGGSEVINDATASTPQSGDLQGEATNGRDTILSTPHTRKTADPASQATPPDTLYTARSGSPSPRTPEESPPKESPKTPEKPPKTPPKESPKPKESDENTIKTATRQLMYPSSNIKPAKRVKSVNKQSPMERAKGPSYVTPVKPLPQRPSPPIEGSGKRLQRKRGAATGRSNVVVKALEPVDKPKRKRNPKSAHKADTLASPLPVPPKNEIKMRATALDNDANVPVKANVPAPSSPGITHYDQIKRLKLPGVQKLVAKYNISIPEADSQSPRKIKAHLKRHFGL
jgi:hypothetical protein